MVHPITLDKERNLKFGMRAISLIEKNFGNSISKINFSALTMEKQAVFIWAGLVHEDKELTPDQVMDLVDEYSTPKKVFDAVTAAINEAFNGQEEPDNSDKDGDEEDSEKNG